MKTLKNYLKPFITGVIATAFIVLIMLKVTIDMQLILFIGTVTFFISGLINNNNSKNNLIVTFLITFIFSFAFVVTVLKEISGLWYFIPIYISATLIGLLFKKQTKKSILLLSILVLIMSFLSIKIIPKNIEESLTKTRFDKLPQFVLNEISGEKIDSNTLKGKVVVLDFFGTWCKPCIAELKELDKVKAAFKDNPNVLFYVVNADIGGDTPEKFKALIKKWNYTFNYAYDHNSVIYKLLGLERLGVPITLIIDKEQNIRLQHVGFNSAETHFKDGMIEAINSLLKEKPNTK